MIARGAGLRPSGGLLGIALACFALGFAVAFVLQWAFDARALQDAKAANTMLEQRVQDLEAELRRNPTQRLQARPQSQSLGEPVKVQTLRVGPDGMPRADR
jgi:hypothetical protein